MPHIPPENIDFYARRGLSEPKNPEIEAHLADCLLCRSRLAAAVDFARALLPLQREAAEMRNANRIPTDAPATLQVLILLSPDHWEVRIRDISKGGMCVLTPKPIERGAQVKVQRGTIVACGEVRYCIAVGEKFQAGILLREIR
jgi:hypothetical protein